MALKISTNLCPCLMAVLYRRNFLLSISYAMKADFRSFARKTKPHSACDHDNTPIFEWSNCKKILLFVERCMFLSNTDLVLYSSSLIALQSS
jgi:hypothetical protein